MDTTRASLLIRIKNPRDTEAWAQFHDLYAPLMYRYARARGLSHEDAEDIRSTCYEAIVRQIQDFEYDRERGGFKAWLRILVHRRVVDRLRRRREVQAASGELQELADGGSSPDTLWELHWKQQHLRYCLQQVRPRVNEQTYRIFEMFLEAEADVEEICQQLDVTRNHVYKAKARVLRMIRTQMAMLYSEVDGEHR